MGDVKVTTSVFSVQSMVEICEMLWRRNSQYSFAAAFVLQGLQICVCMHFSCEQYK